MQERHYTPTLLHEQHQTERPEVQVNAPAREVVHERNANHTAVSTIERDEHGRIVRRTSRELQRVFVDVFGAGEQSMSDLSLREQNVTVDRYEYDPDSGHLVTEVQEKFSGMVPETPYFTRTTANVYTEGGELEEMRIEFKGFGDARPLTCVSRVTLRDDQGRPLEIDIEDNRLRDTPQNIKRIRTYDETGHVATEVDYAVADGKKTEKEFCGMKYDEQGRLLERERRVGGEVSISKYEYQDLPDGGRVETRRAFDAKGREGMGERVTLGPDGAKLRYESWFSPGATFGDTTWTTAK